MLVSFLKAALLAYLLLCVCVFLFQSKLIWFPGAPPVNTPAAAGLKWSDLDLRASDGVALHGWRIDASEPRGLVVFCHGNAGSIENRLDAARALVDLGVSVLLFDYRGYGRSEGSPSEEGTYLDAEAAWEHATGEAGFASERIVAWGESLGGAVAIELARRRPVRALVTEGAFTSIPAVGAGHYWWLPVRWLARVKYDNLAKLGGLRQPWLLLHSPRDEVVPFDHAQRLFEAAKSARAAAGSPAPVELVPTRGGHNDGGFLVDRPAIHAVKSFLERVLD